MIHKKAYYYQDKPYGILGESKFKIYDYLISLGVNRNIVASLIIGNQSKWIDVVIYETLYDNPDGKVWVREKEEFYTLFKLKEDNGISRNYN